MKKIIFAFILLCGFAFANAQTAKNPFEKYGFKKVRAYSFSKGEFEEFHDNKEIVEIGSVLYNTKTKKVVGYVKATDKDVPAATPAMSIDPLCEKYPWISPYAYCMNNPVRYVDPDGRDGMVTGTGTKEDPYIITATYLYKNGGLSEAQVKGLNSAVNAYNKSGGKNGVEIKNADGSKSYVKYNLNAVGVDNVDEARLGTAFEVITGETRYYGNIVGINPNEDGAGDEYGSAHSFEVNFNPENLALGVSEGMSSDKLHKGVAIHEIGHNLGGEHSDGTSVMDVNLKTESFNQMGGTITVSYNYPSMNNKFTKIIFGRRDVPRQTFSGAGRLWTKKH